MSQTHGKGWREGNVEVIEAKANKMTINERYGSLNSIQLLFCYLFIFYQILNIKK
jgi:hypothetical protein